MTSERTRIYFSTRILLYLCNVSVCSMADVQYGRATHFQDNDNLYFENNHIMHVHNVFSTVSCAILCGQDPQCRSFFYNENQSACRLHNENDLVKSDGIAASAWTFYVYKKSCPIDLGFISDETEGLCIYISSDLHSFAAGQQTCDELGSEVISLRTVSKSTAFANMMNKLMENSALFPLINQKQFYINLREIDTEVWQWGNGDNVTLSDANFGDGQPYCTSTCTCVTAFEDWDWKWNDVSCIEDHRLVCEYV